PQVPPSGCSPPCCWPLATLSAAFGSAFQYGYNIAVVNTPHQSFYNETYFERHGTFMDEKVLLLLWSCTVSMFPLGGLLGSLVVGLLVDRCGRKGTLLINNIFAILPAILMGVSKVAQAFELIIFSRVLVGVCAGISYSALPMYLGELAPKNLRGTLGTMTEVFVIIGIFLAQIFSLQAVLGNPTVLFRPSPLLTLSVGVITLYQTHTHQRQPPRRQPGPYPHLRSQYPCLDPNPGQGAGTGLSLSTPQP
uniref:Solute carrier family 2 member 7 n=1 Tax=Spermophilus dauricus TaxID=99837 RepID=A0A8C9QBJ8_SPEDA